MKKVIALLSSLILTSCSMFNSEAPYKRFFSEKEYPIIKAIHDCDKDKICLLYTSPSPRDYAASRMPSSA